MSLGLIYLVLLILELIFFAGFAIFTIFLIYSSLCGSSYVPTSMKEVDKIFKIAYLKKNQVFLDLGCGDGRIVRYAVKNFQVKGIGTEINMALIYWARLLSWMSKLNIDYRFSNMVKDSLPKADIIYLFLMPNLIEKIADKLLTQLNQDTLIISHGFKINKLSKFLYKTIDGKPFLTYLYKRQTDI